MASGAVVSGLDRLVEAVEAAEAAAAARRSPRQVPGGFECPHPGCGRIFSKRYNQQAHMRLHDGTRPFNCDLCGKAFMWKSSLKSHARMHAKMSAVHNPPSLSVRPHSNARLHASESAVAKSSHRVSKRKGKNASPSVKRKSCQPRHTVSAADANFAIIAPNVVSAVAGVPLQIPSDKKQALSEKHNTGRQSPDSVTMLDRDAAKVLTMFQ